MTIFEAFFQIFCTCLLDEFLNILIYVSFVDLYFVVIVLCDFIHHESDFDLLKMNYIHIFSTLKVRTKQFPNNILNLRLLLNITRNQALQAWF